MCNLRGIKNSSLTGFLASKLFGRQELENPHRPLATGATPHCRFIGVGRLCWRRSRQQSSAEWQKETAPPIRQEAEVSDAREASWEHVFEETMQEDLMLECHRTPLVVMGVVFPAEGHLSIGNVNQPMVGDCDTMRVPGQIVQDVAWTTEWSLGINHPVLSKERAEEGMERLLIRQRKACAIERELLPAESALETGHKLPAENPAQNSHREKEPRRRSDPPLPVQR
jgi:hypothetical protein